MVVCVLKGVWNAACVVECGARCECRAWVQCVA